MAQLAEMGVAIPDEFRPEMALAGEWHTVEKPVESQEQRANAGLNIGVRKRKFEGKEEEEEAGEVVAKRGWGLTTRSYPGAKGDDGGDDELEALLGMTANIKKKKTEQTASVKQEEGESETQHATITSKQESVEKSPVTKEEPDTQQTDLGTIPAESQVSSVKKEDRLSPEVKKEDSKTGSSETTSTGKDTSGETQPTIIFKKRKPKQIKR